MYIDIIKYVENYPKSTIIIGTARRYKPPLNPIPVSRPFETVGADLMELLRIRKGNSTYVLVL